MSIRTNPMKAAPTLLKHPTVEKRADLKDLKDEMINIKKFFTTVKKIEEQILDTLTVVHGYLHNKNIRKLLEEKEEICKKIRSLTQKFLPAAATQSSNKEAAPSSYEEKTFQGVKPDNRQQVHGALSSSQLQDMEKFKMSYLNAIAKHRLWSLTLFPENAVIKKRNIILWLDTVVGSVKQLWETITSEYLFELLLNFKLFVPHGNGKYRVVRKFEINPWVHHKSMRPFLQDNEQQSCGIYSQIITSSDGSDTRYDCLGLDQKKVKLGDGFGLNSNHCRAVFNVAASYLNFGPQWMAKMKDLEVLQLGRWLHDSQKHHIEVESEEFLKELRDQKDLKYLSLRGISGISKLPPSILQLERLETLDLKACHNLETLPKDIASLRNLRHLDLSRCCLLDRMPTGIEKLPKLEVLKGFVIGSSSKTPCRISDLAANLKRLERLSIHIGSGAVVQDGEFESLDQLSKLEHLKISWGVSDKRYSDIKIILPSSLKKLHLEGFPGENIPEWLKPSELLKEKEAEPEISVGVHPPKPPKPVALTELNITGGKLKSMDHEENNKDWRIKIVRLKYLKHLKVDLTNLHELFPLLRYVEIKQILNPPYFEWRSIN